MCCTNYVEMQYENMTYLFPSNCGPYRIQRLKTHGPIVLRGQVVFIKIPRGAVASTLGDVLERAPQTFTILCSNSSNFYYFQIFLEHTSKLEPFWQILSESLHLI